MTVAAGDIANFQVDAMRVALRSFEALSPDDRAVLKEMLDEFLEITDDETRAEIAISILEFIIPAGQFFNLEDGDGIDGWIRETQASRDALAKLKLQKRRFSRKMKELMEANEVNQAELAKRLGVTQPTVHHMINGKHKPQPRTLERLAEAFGISVEELWPFK